MRVLLNLAEDLSVESKIAKRDIVKYLVKLMERDDQELVQVAVLFLSKLSVFVENIEEMKISSVDLIKSLIALAKSSNLKLQETVFNLLLNLSHDVLFRDSMVRSSILPVLGDKLKLKISAGTVTKLIYQLTLQDSHRSSPYYSEIIPTCLQLVNLQTLQFEPTAILINLATVPEHIKFFGDANVIRSLLRTAIQKRDLLIFKLIRNLSQHPDSELKVKIMDSLDDMLVLMKTSLDNPDLVQEILGIVGNLTLKEFDFRKLAETHSLLPFCTEIILSSLRKSEKDEYNDKDGVLLMVISLLGTMTLDESILPDIARSEIPSLLVEIMLLKRNDDEIILQSSYCLYHFLLHRPLQKILAANHRILGILIDLFFTDCIEIQKIGAACLDVLSVLVC